MRVGGYQTLELWHDGVDFVNDRTVIKINIGTSQSVERCTSTDVPGTAIRAFAALS